MPSQRSGYWPYPNTMKYQNGYSGTIRSWTLLKKLARLRNEGLVERASGIRKYFRVDEHLHLSKFQARYTIFTVEDPSEDDRSTVTWK